MSRRSRINAAATKVDIATTPANAGNRLNVWNPKTNAYNLKASNTGNIRSALAKALANTAIAPIIFEGDSKTAGLGTNGGGRINASNTMPGTFRKILSSRGYAIAGTGLVTGSSNGSTTTDGRYTYGGSWSANNGVTANYASAGPIGDTLTFASDYAGEVVKLVSPTNTGPYSILIDSGVIPNGQVSVVNGTYVAGLFTSSGGTGTATITITGLSNATHTVAITTTGAAGTYLTAISCGHATGLEIHNIGISGSTTANWVTGVFYQSSAVALAIPGIATVLSLGVNDAKSSVPLLTYKANMNTIINAHKALSRDVLIVVPSPPQISQVSTAIWDSFVSAMYDLADSQDIPLIDMTAAYQSWVLGNAKGLYYDNLHENELGYAFNGIGLVNALGA